MNDYQMAQMQSALNVKAAHDAVDELLHMANSSLQGLQIVQNDLIDLTKVSTRLSILISKLSGRKNIRVVE